MTEYVPLTDDQRSNLQRFRERIDEALDEVGGGCSSNHTARLSGATVNLTWAGAVADARVSSRVVDAILDGAFAASSLIADLLAADAVARTARRTLEEAWTPMSGSGTALVGGDS